MISPPLFPWILERARVLDGRLKLPRALVPRHFQRAWSVNGWEILVPSGNPLHSELENYAVFDG